MAIISFLVKSFPEGLQGLLSSTARVLPVSSFSNSAMSGTAKPWWMSVGTALRVMPLRYAKVW